MTGKLCYVNDMGRARLSIRVDATLCAPQGHISVDVVEKLSTRSLK